MTSEHTPGRTYPREWYKVNTYGEIRAETFIAETEHKLRQPDRRGRKRYENKASSWYWWHPTLEEAEAHAAKIKSAQDERAAAERVRNAAPDLLEALKGLVVTYSDPECGEVDRRNAMRDASAAIAKATGAAQ